MGDMKVEMLGYHTRTTKVLVVVRDPDASNDYTLFVNPDIGPFGVHVEGLLFVVDIDAGADDLRDSLVWEEWSDGHNATATMIADRFPEAADFIRNIVEGYDPGEEEA